MAMMVDNGCTPLTDVTCLCGRAEWDCSYSKCTADLNMQKDELSVLQKDDLTKPNKDDLNMQKEKLSVLNENLSVENSPAPLGPRLSQDDA